VAEGTMGGGAAGVDRRGPRVRILLVDEDSKDLQLYRSVLQEQGHVVDCCATFPEAGERLERAWYDLIIFSEEGRTFNGQALLERAIELNRYRPVLVLTRFVDRRTYVDAIYLGALDYIEKPLAPPFLFPRPGRRAVRMPIEQRRLGRRFFGAHERE